MELVHSHDVKPCEDNQAQGWCFWDETGSCNGPFATKVISQAALEEYGRWLHAGPDTGQQ